MSLSKPLRGLQLDVEPVYLGARAQHAPAFIASEKNGPVAPALERRLPRTWTELETLLEERLAAFEERRRKEEAEAFERGVQEGLRRQHSSVDQRIAAARRPLSNVAQAVQSELALLREDMYRQTSELAAALTATLVGRLLQLNPAAFLPALRDALEPLRHMDDIRVRLNPTDHETLKAGLGSGEDIFTGLDQIEVVSDANVAAGGAVAESRGGTVDARLETRLKTAIQLLSAGSHVGG
jgi:flagellar assembly protein FliH